MSGGGSSGASHGCFSTLRTLARSSCQPSLYFLPGFTWPSPRIHCGFGGLEGARALHSLMYASVRKLRGVYHVTHAWHAAVRICRVITYGQGKGEHPSRDGGMEEEGWRRRAIGKATNSLGGTTRGG